MSLRPRTPRTDTKIPHLENETEGAATCQDSRNACVVCALCRLGQKALLVYRIVASVM